MERLYIWTIYRKGSKEFPFDFVAFQRDVTPEGEPGITGVMLGPELEPLRAELRRQGYIVMPRFPEDSENIIETWL